MRAAPALLLTALLLACAAADDEVASGAEAPAATASAVDLPPAEATRPGEQLPSDRIYYDLTRFGWYARGEPLRHEGTGYQPAGLPMAAPVNEMQLVGTYEGVEYYRHENDAELLFVPVFDGYWLAFRPTRQAIAGAD